MATTAVGVARAKAAQAGYPHRGLSGPRKPRRSFGRWSPFGFISPRQRPTHSLKGSVPVSPAHVSVRRNAADGGGGGATKRVYCGSTAGMRQNPTSNVIQDIDPCTVSKVLRPRLPRTSRCGFGRPMAVTEARNHALYSCFYSWHAMCAAAGWYVELTERGFLQELGSDCGHMAARNAPKQLQCMQCELYKFRDACKTKQCNVSGAGLRHEHWGRRRGWGKG